MAKFERVKLAKYIAEHLDDNNLSDQVAGYLIDCGKVSELDSLLRDVMEIRAEDQGIMELVATTAHSLNAESRKSVEALVKSKFSATKEVVIHENIDKSVIGGVDLDFANANLNMTVRAKLNKLKEAVA